MKKNMKVRLALLLSLAMVFSAFLPVTNVNAEDNSGGKKYEAEYYYCGLADFYGDEEAELPLSDQASFTNDDIKNTYGTDYKWEKFDSSEGDDYTCNYYQLSSDKCVIWYAVHEADSYGDTIINKTVVTKGSSFDLPTEYNGRALKWVGCARYAGRYSADHFPFYGNHVDSVDGSYYFGAIYADEEAKYDTLDDDSKQRLFSDIEEGKTHQEPYYKYIYIYGTTIPKDVLSAMKGSDLTLQAYGNENYRVDIEGKDITDDSKDLNVKTEFANKVSSSNVKALAGDNFTSQFQLLADGALGVKITLSYEAGQKYANKKANVFRVNNEGKFEYYKTFDVDEYGDMNIELTQGKDYIVVVSDSAMSQADADNANSKITTPSTPETPSVPLPTAGTTFTNPNNGSSYEWVAREDGELVLYKDGAQDSNEFVSDGNFTYYCQADGTVMKDQLTYHPNGEHVIYFDPNGREAFNAFAHVSKSITGDAVDDFCYFDTNGYMYVDTVTYDVTGTKLYYINEYGKMQHSGWFTFSKTAKTGDQPTPWNFTGSYIGYAQYDGTLLINQSTYDWEGRACYMQGNGEAKY